MKGCGRADCDAEQTVMPFGKVVLDSHCWAIKGERENYVET
jgi:hypothetical protein